MSSRCSECGGATIWDDEASSKICTSCGTMSDPSQSVLTTDQYDMATVLSGWDSSTPATLKSYRESNWNLAGQGKEANDRKNSFAIGEFIKSLALSMNASGLTPRIVTLFKQARAARPFRWGRKAKIVAGACLSIALRESDRPDALYDISFLLEEPQPLLTRTFISLTSLLRLPLTLLGPSVYITTIQAHVASGVADKAYSGALDNLCLRSVANTARSLCTIVPRLAGEEVVTHLTTPPTACAIFMLSIEAENRVALKNAGKFAQCLGGRFGVGKEVIMSRYKLIQDEIAVWIDRIPWLEKYDKKNGRAKVAKRMIVARGLKDVIKFQQENWSETVKPTVELDIDGDESSMDENDLDKTTLKRSRPQEPNGQRHTRKRQKTDYVQQAIQLLLDPLSTPIAARRSSTQSSKCDPSKMPYSSPLVLASYFLTADTFSLSSRRLPTRLQQLAVHRGGSGVDEIPDEELFEEGEWDSILRSEEDIRTLQGIVDWDNSESDSSIEEDIGPATKIQGSSASRQGNLQGKINIKSNSRLNFEAFERFMQSDNEGESAADILELSSFAEGEDDSDGESYKDDRNVDESENHFHSPNAGHVKSNKARTQPGLFAVNASQDAEVVILDNWRPVSPGGPSQCGYYDEEKWEPG